MIRPSQTVFFDGAAGPMQTLVDEPDAVRGLAVVGHPHPLLGGTNANKVAYTLAHCLRDLGYLALRPNFRGVGRSGGTHDQGNGETDDMVALLTQAQQRWGGSSALPVVLAGFSFGAYVQTRVAKRLTEAGQAPQRVVLVALATSHGQQPWPYPAEPVAADSILIHGDRDDTIPLANVLAYAEPLSLPVVVIPGADHFFHGRLQLIREIIQGSWQGSWPKP